MAKTLQISDLLEKKQLAKKMRLPYERDWSLNMAFVAGEQYVNYAYEPVNRLVELEDEPNVIRAVHNICIKIARNETARIVKTRPVPTALPVTDSEDDEYASRVMDAYFRYLQDEWNFDRRIRNAVYWLVVTGNMFLKWYWDGQKNQMAVINPFDLYIDPYAKTFLDARWVIHTQFMSEDEAKEMFKGVKGADLSVLRTSNTDALTPVETKIFSQFGDGNTNLPGVILHEYWEPPNATNPQGRWGVFTDQGVVTDGKFPYAHGRLPFTHAGHIERTNAKYHASVLDFVRPLQIELNRAESQIIENRNLANGIWFIPAEIETDTEITGEPRQVIKWTGPPTVNPQQWFVQPQGMAAWVGTEPDRIKATAQDIVSQHEVSNGGVPGRVESGQAIQLLQETDDSVLNTTIRAVEECIADGFLMTALLFKQFEREEVVIRAYDKDGTVEVRTIKADMIPLDMRVRVRTETGLPQTIAGKWDRVLNLLQYQVIQPERAIELLDLSVEDPELKPDLQDRKNAYRENKEMLNVETIIRAKVYDNHDSHIDEHYKFMKTDEYRQAVAADPRIEQNYNFHVDEHKQLRQQVDTENVQRQALLSGQAPPPPDGGGGGGEGPPPVDVGQGGPEIQPPVPPEPAPNGSPAPVA